MSDQAPIDTRSAEIAPWRDPRLSPAERAELLVPLMTLEEKVNQLVGMWVGAESTGGGVAPLQADMAGVDHRAVIRHGPGQLTRPFGTKPVDPVAGAHRLAASQPMGPRELADVILPPFEMALRLGGARSVMNSYVEIDGVPVAALPLRLVGAEREAGHRRRLLPVVSVDPLTRERT
jgi:hypothetical protein